jgi:D-serine deaminase-like pyridoxal phosphate-dependent protein
MDWYAIQNADELDTPALVFYPERIQRNLERVRKYFPDVQMLRPHIKTSKCTHVVRLMLAAGITRFKCATIAEAEMLAEEGAKDVLLAYQPVGPKAKRFCDLHRKFSNTAFSCLIDNGGPLRALSTLASGLNIKVRVLIDLNTGMNRTGIAPEKEALKLYMDAGASRGIDVIGLHAYDGHLRDEDLAERKRKCDDAFRAVTDLAAEIKSATGKDPLIVTGGTPTFPIHARRGNVECSPGTFILWDKGYQQILREQPFEFAALVVSRIISNPKKDTLCLDLGHKSIASENPLPQRVHFLNAPDLQPISHSEEHMVCRAPEGHGYQVGQVLYGVPHHICPTVALYDEATTCIQNRLADAWPITARRRKISL